MLFVQTAKRETSDHLLHSETTSNIPTLPSEATPISLLCLPTVHFLVKDERTKGRVEDTKEHQHQRKATDEIEERPRDLCISWLPTVVQLFQWTERKKEIELCAETPERMFPCCVQCLLLAL